MLSNEIYSDISASLAFHKDTPPQFYLKACNGRMYLIDGRSKPRPTGDRHTPCLSPGALNFRNKYGTVNVYLTKGSKVL